ncbi:MAG: hypothetical protein AABZ35_04770 [Gemmatimonadota bacterium]|jgi:hypothetical protein
MTRLSVIACLLPSALAAQQRGFTVGVTGFTGGNWQPSGIEVGTLRAVGAAPGQSVALMLRLGGFVQDQAVLVGGSTGFFMWVIGAYRRPIVTIAAMGSERALSYARLVGVLELGISKDFNSPLPQGAARGTGAVLFGISFGGGGRIDENFAILAGPALFVGDASSAHAQVTMRFQSPLGRGRRRGPPEGP